MAVVVWNQPTEVQDFGHQLVSDADSLLSRVEHALENFDPGHLAASTREAYEQAAKWLEDDIGLLQAAECGKTFHFRRAAMKFECRSRLLRWLSQSDNSVDAELELEILEEIDAQIWEEISETRGISPRSSRGRHKGRLDRYGDGWEFALFESASLTTKNMIAVLQHCGCRPKEFEAGVTVRAERLTGGGWRFRFKIIGAKVSECSPPGHERTFATGQSWRRFCVEVQPNPISDHLGRSAIKKGGKLTIRYKASQVTNAIVNASRRLWPDREAEDRPAAYSFRHAFASVLKTQEGRALELVRDQMDETPANRDILVIRSVDASLEAKDADFETLCVEGSSETIGRALGHSSARTQACYGRPKRRSSVKFVISEVDSASPVRARTICQISGQAVSQSRGIGRSAPSATIAPC